MVGSMANGQVVIYCKVPIDYVGSLVTALAGKRTQDVSGEMPWNGNPSYSECRNTYCAKLE